jgi:type I restriction enzyme S subunit
MISDRLRKSVLQLAIEGKLTVQLQTDDDPRTLFSPTQSCTNVELPFEIPESWMWLKFDLVIKNLSSRKHQILSSEVKSEGIYPVVSQSKNFIDGFSDDSEKLLKINQPIILFGDHSKTLKYIDFDFIVGADGTKLLQVLKCNSKYIYYVLMCYINSLETRNYGRHFKLLSSRLVPVPSLAEQKRIVEKLDELLPLIDDLEKDENKLNELMQKFPESMETSILKAAIQGKLTDQLLDDGHSIDEYNQIKLEKQKTSKKKGNTNNSDNEEPPFDIPDNWIWTTLDDISIIITSGGTPSRTNPRLWTNGTIPWLKIKDIKSKYIEKAEEYITDEGLQNSSAKIFPKGTLLYTIFATIGDCGILNFEASTNQAIAGITLVDDLIFKEYIYYVLMSAKAIMMSKSRGMAQFNINQEILKKLQIPLPPIKEQKRIVEKLNEILPIVEKINSDTN